jgi:DNA-directed RNA polymerase subunit beta'
MKNLVDFTGLKITIASPEEMKGWSHGEITKPETINYRTLKPEKDGLFCERIFGPTKDWECYCGKYKRIRYRGIVCDKCGVEVTLSRVRRERMGHLGLAAPVAHVWYFKGAPSKLSLLLDISPKKLASVIYFSRFLVLSVDTEKREATVKKLEEESLKKKEEISVKYDKLATTMKKEGVKTVKAAKKGKEAQVVKEEELKLKSKQQIAALREQMLGEQNVTEEIYATVIDLVNKLEENSLLTEDEYLKLSDYNAVDWVEVGMGAEAVLEAIRKVNLEDLVAKLRETIKEGSEAKRLQATKRLQVVMGLLKASIKPEWMILRVLPVIPPDLRPMVQLSGGRFATSDLNDLYRRVINRNNRLKHLLELGAPDIILRNEKRMLQEAVDGLIDAPQSTTTAAAASTN